jgi:hypothetical protein
MVLTGSPIDAIGVQPHAIPNLSAALHRTSAALGLVAVSAAAATAALSLVPSHEESMLREAVAGICDGFGRDYMQRKSDAGEPPSELWEALASRGYLGSTFPRSTTGVVWGWRRCRGWARRSPRPAARCC